MATKSITIHVDDLPVEVVLKSARKRDGIRYVELMRGAINFEDQDPNRLLTAEEQLHVYVWPACVAAVKTPPEIRNMTFEDFMEKVDDVDVNMWLAAAYELNPQWRPPAPLPPGAQPEPMSEEDQKKILMSSDGSTEPTAT